MGYTTDFIGSFQFNREVSVKEKEYINRFSDTRRMKRDVNKLMELYEGKHGYPFPYLLSGQVMNNTPETIYGKDGEYFAREDGNSGQVEDNSILDYNLPPGQAEYTGGGDDFSKRWAENQKRIKEGVCQPGLWCQWVVSDDGENLEWDGEEKFYEYIAWLKYLINHFFSKWGLVLNGEVEWEGEDSQDRGKIVVKDNVVKVLRGEITYKESDE